MGILRIGGEKQSRKYVDLMKEVSSKYANWQPAKRVDVGDYGELNRDTCEFEVEGNVYKEPTFADIVSGLEPVHSEPMNQYVLCSKDVVAVSPTASVGADALGLAATSMAGQWSFGRKRAAVLMMARPRISSMPGPLVKKLASVKLMKEEHKSVVTEVFTCPAYAYYMSTTKDEMLTLQLRTKLPTPSAPGVAATAAAGFEWYHDHAGGAYQDACALNDEYQFTPLFHLKKSPRRILYRERAEPAPEEDYELVDTVPTWNILDDEGEEFQDYVSD